MNENLTLQKYFEEMGVFMTSLKLNNDKYHVIQK